MVKWWSQSYLVGIPRVVCGFRDTYGIIHTLRTYQVEELPKLAQVCHLYTINYRHITNQGNEVLKSTQTATTQRFIYIYVDFCFLLY